MKNLSRALLACMMLGASASAEDAPLAARLSDAGLKCNFVNVLSNGFFSFGYSGAWGATFERMPTDEEITNVARLVQAGVTDAILYVQSNGVWGVLEAGSKLCDLTPFKGLPIETLDISSTAVSNLAPLTGMALRNLTLSGIPVADIAPLKGMPLTCLNITSTQVSDLSPLEGMSLERFFFLPNRIGKGMNAVREMKTLKLIGTMQGDCWPPDEFWGKYDAGEFR